MKKISIVIIILVGALLLLVAGKNVIAKAVVERFGSVMSGSKLTIEKMEFTFLSSKITLSDLKLYNPRGSKDPVMADIPELYVSYEASTLFSGKPHLNELRINLREFHVIKDEKGALNLKLLHPSPPMTIDLLRLKIEKVIYKDYSKHDLNPEAHEYKINLDETYRNVSDINSIGPLIASKTLSEMEKLILGKIGAAGKGAVSDTANKAEGVAEKVSGKAAQEIKNLFGAISH